MSEELEATSFESIEAMQALMREDQRFDRFITGRETKEQPEP